MSVPNLTARTNPNPTHTTLISRASHLIFVKGPWHLGFYEKDTWWPFPTTPARRAMEDKLVESLNLPPGSHLLDAGCRAGNTAIYLIQEWGYKVFGIDIMKHHQRNARYNADAARVCEHNITIQEMDYHHIDPIKDNTFDGVYTMEALMHAHDPQSVINGFHRVLRPGGRIALFEYDHFLDTKYKSPTAFTTAVPYLSRFGAVCENERSHPDVFARLLERAGFTDIVVKDYSENIRPLARVLFHLAWMPYMVIAFLGWKAYFIGIVGCIEAYMGLMAWRYVAVSARKPERGEVVGPAKWDVASSSGFSSDGSEDVSYPFSSAVSPSLPSAPPPSCYSVRGEDS